MEWTTIVGVADDCIISRGAVSGTCDLSIQLKDWAGNNLTEKGRVAMYISSDSDGLVISDVTTATLTGTGIINKILDKYSYEIITETDGSAVVRLDGTSANSRYMNVVLPNGRVKTSDIVTFTG